jgi:hypothetical protein
MVTPPRNLELWSPQRFAPTDARFARRPGDRSRVGSHGRSVGGAYPCTTSPRCSGPPAPASNIGGGPRSPGCRCRQGGSRAWIILLVRADGQDVVVRQAEEAQAPVLEGELALDEPCAGTADHDVRELRGWKGAAGGQGCHRDVPQPPSRLRAGCRRRHDGLAAKNPPDHAPLERAAAAGAVTVRAGPE